MTSLRGGNGKNSYLIEGDDTIEGSDGVDIIYIKRPKANLDLESCTQESWAISDNSSYNGNSAFEAAITQADILIFLDGRNKLE